MTREAELELEIARLRGDVKTLGELAQALDSCGEVADNPKAVWLQGEAMEEFAERALSTPPSTTELQELITEVERRTIERCASICDLEASEYGTNQDGWYAARVIAELIRDLK